MTYRKSLSEKLGIVTKKPWDPIVGAVQMKRPEWASDRNMQMFRELLEGNTLRSLGDKYGISYERVRQLCQTIRRRACQGSNQEERREFAKLRADTASTEGMRINREALLERVEAYLEGLT